MNERLVSFLTFYMDRCFEVRRVTARKEHPLSHSGRVEGVGLEEHHETKKYKAMRLMFSFQAAHRTLYRKRRTTFESRLDGQECLDNKWAPHDPIVATDKHETQKGESSKSVTCAPKLPLSRKPMPFLFPQHGEKICV